MKASITKEMSQDEIRAFCMFREGCKVRAIAISGKQIEGVLTSKLKGGRCIQYVGIYPTFALKYIEEL